MLWGGRFKENLDDKALKFSSSLNIDKRLFFEDIKGSIAHAAMLSKSKIISKADSDLIINGLKKIEANYKSGLLNFDNLNFEDIHSAIEAELYKQIGETAGKLHTGRSRNDQVLTALKLYLKKAILQIEREIKKFQLTLLKIAEKHTETIIPGYTHLQRAQIISLAFHLLAYVHMLQRDKERFSFCKTAINLNPLGSSALAGSTLPLNRNFTTKQLGFNKPTPNTLDTVSDRDFLLDFLNAISISFMHLSRFAEEIILWNSTEWNFIQLSDKYTTGSSLMPQKKNPDMAELIRGKCGRVYSNYISLAVTLKGLPLSYNRDLQEDKEPIFDSLDTYLNSIVILNDMLKTAKFNINRFKDELIGSSIFATDLADYLVKKGLPFRKSHEIVGKLIKLSEEKNIKLNNIPLSEYKTFSPLFEKNVYDLFDINKCLYNKVTYGSPNPKLVLKEIIELKKII